MSLIEQAMKVVRLVPGGEELIRQTLDKRYHLARKHLRGCGLEIGALDRPLWLPRGATVYYVDRMVPADLYRHYPELSHRKFYVSVVGDGETLDFVHPGSCDFIIANHVIEHCQDPIRTLKTFARCLRPDGIVFLAVPDKRRTFDVNRELTSFEHLRLDHEEGPERSRERHYFEWAEYVESKAGKEIATRAHQLMDEDYSIHFHCWDRDCFVDFIGKSHPMTGLEVGDIRSWTNENIFILRNRRHS